MTFNDAKDYTLSHSWSSKCIMVLFELLLYTIVI